MTIDDFIRDWLPYLHYIFAAITSVVVAINEVNRNTPDWWTVEHPILRKILWVVEVSNVIILRTRVPKAKRPPVVFPD